MESTEPITIPIKNATASGKVEEGWEQLLLLLLEAYA